MDANYLITHLQLLPHPEGGYYRSSFQSEETKEMASHDGNRHLYTSIYFLLRSTDISHLHRLKSDELWYFHAGSPLTVHILDEEGNYRQEKLGLDLAAGQMPQVKVEKGSIFGSTVDQPDTFALVGCMVAPGFDFADFELFTQAELLEKFPLHKSIIERLALRKSF